MNLQRKKRFGCLALALLLLLLCGCSLIRQSMQNVKEKQAETDALLVQLMTCIQNNDVMGAASLFYDPMQMQQIFTPITDYWPAKSTDEFESCSFNYNISIPGKEQDHSDVRAVYRVNSNGEDYQVTMVTRRDADSESIVSFNVVRVQELIDAGIEPETSKFPVAKKSLGQWCFTAFWLVSCILCLVTIVDIIRNKPKLWGLWILCALAFLGPQLTTSPNGFQVGVRFGILNLSQWTRHLNETNHFELCFPIGAIIYWCRRRQLLAKKSGTAYAVPAQAVPAQTVPTQTVPTQPAPVQPAPSDTVPSTGNPPEQVLPPEQAE